MYSAVMPGFSGLSNQNEERSLRFPLSAPFGPFDVPPLFFILSVLSSHFPHCEARGVGSL